MILGGTRQTRERRAQWNTETTRLPEADNRKEEMESADLPITNAQQSHVDKRFNVIANGIRLAGSVESHPRKRNKVTARLNANRSEMHRSIKPYPKTTQQPDGNVAWPQTLRARAQCMPANTTKIRIYEPTNRHQIHVSVSVDHQRNQQRLSLRLYHHVASLLNTCLPASAANRRHLDAQQCAKRIHLQQKCGFHQFTRGQDPSGNTCQNVRDQPRQQKKNAGLAGTKRRVSARMGKTTN